MSIIMRRLMLTNLHNCQGRKVRRKMVNRVGCVAYGFVFASLTFAHSFFVCFFAAGRRAHSGIIRQPLRSRAL